MVRLGHILLGPAELGINLKFGRYTGKTAAGLETNWPWPMRRPVWDQPTRGIWRTPSRSGASRKITSL